jgi:DNA polymerase-4
VEQTIAHLDLDAFYASVELQRRPELRGLPVIVSGASPRAVVTTCSYEARAFGVHSAMPTSRARRLCPDAVLVPPDFPAYRAASERVWEIVAAHVETVERLGLDEGYLDLTGLMSPRTAMRRLVTEIETVTGLHASVGIGPNRLVAKVASDCEKPRGLVVLTREQACARFADHAPSLVPGIGPKTSARLGGMGLTTLRHVREADPDALVRAFGANLGRDLQRRAAFHGSSAVVTERETKSQSSETTFDRDLTGLDDQLAVIDRLSADLCGRLERGGLTGRTIAIKVRLDDWTTVTRSRTIDGPTHELATVARVAKELLRAYAPPRPVRLLGVRMAGFVGETDAAGATGPSGPDDQLQLAV